MAAFVMKIVACLLVLNLAGLLTVEGKSLLNKFSTCRPKEKDFQKCFKESLDQALKFLVKGSHKFNIVPMDPLNVPKMVIGDKNGAVGFLLTFENCNFYGMGGINVLSAKVDPEKYTFDINLKLPYNIISGPYEVNGRVLLLPIRGKGNINFTCDEPHLNWKIQGKPVTRDGKTYFDVQSFKLTSKITTGSIHLSNLFDGDKALGDGMNRFLNENFKDVVSTVLPYFDETMGMVMKGLTKRIFDQLPYDEIFPNN